MTNHYVKSDGNGGYVISKSFLVIGSFIIAMLGLSIPMVMAYGGLNEQVNNIEDYIELEGPRHNQMYYDLEDRVDECELNIAVVGNDIVQIKGDIEEIKKGIAVLTKEHSK